MKEIDTGHRIWSTGITKVGPTKYGVDNEVLGLCFILEKYFFIFNINFRNVTLFLFYILFFQNEIMKKKIENRIKIE